MQAAYRTDPGTAWNRADARLYLPDQARRSTRQCTPYRLDDASLRRLVEIGVHRQAARLPGQTLAHRKPAVGDRKAAIGFLPVQGLAVIDRRRNPLPAQCGDECLTLMGRDPDRVLRPYRCAVGGDPRNRDHIAEPACIAKRYAIARGDLVRKYLQLFEKYSRLDGVETSGDADADGVVLVDALAVHAQALDDRRELIVVGEDRTA